jgi:hypothetical protein
LKDFVDEPHAAIEGHDQGTIINLTDHRASVSLFAQLDLLDGFGPDGIVRQLSALSEKHPVPSAQPKLPRLVMPVHHDVRAEDVVTRRLRASLVAAASAGPTDFRELLLVAGVGARTIRALAMVAEVVHGAPCRFSDPARVLLRAWRQGLPPVPSTTPRIR